MKNYKQCTSAELFFVELLKERLNIDTKYISLPSCTCFSYCMNELIGNCKAYLQSNKKINHLSMTDIFLKFMKTDHILKSLDEALYYEVLTRLQNISSNSASIEQEYLFFKYVRNVYQPSYFERCYRELISLLKKGTTDYSLLYTVSNTYINELLANRVNYRFLCKIFNEFFYKERFDTIYDFLNYLMCDDENIEMYLPLKNCVERDIQFISEKQVITKEVIDGEEVYFCKIYESSIDFYSICIKNMRRIESILNFFKFYRNSEIDFDYSRKVKVIRKKLDDEQTIEFGELMKYRYFVGKNDIINFTLQNLDTIGEKNNLMYLQINNILNYAEKDNDYLTASSYVDNWIALESLIKVSEIHHGYEGVKLIVPNMLSIKCFRQDLNTCLKNAYYEQYGMSVERFIEYVVERPDELDSIPIKNEYYTYRIASYRKMLLSYKDIKEALEQIEERIAIDIERIYLVRNEYVHASNINATNNMQSILLKRILADSIDCFIKSFNGNVKTRGNAIGGEVYNDIIKKYSIRKTALEILIGNLKVFGNKIGKKQLVSPVSDKEILNNLIFERRTIFNTAILENFH